MRHWQELVTQIHAAEQRHVTIALVGKYTELHDAYLSVAESLFHAGTACGAQVDIQWVDSQHLTAENPHGNALRVQRHIGARRLR